MSSNPKSPPHSAQRVRITLSTKCTTQQIMIGTTVLIKYNGHMQREAYKKTREHDQIQHEEQRRGIYRGRKAFTGDAEAES
jgi:hypothetical protein